MGYWSKGCFKVTWAQFAVLISGLGTEDMNTHPYQSRLHSQFVTAHSAQPCSLEPRLPAASYKSSTGCDVQLTKSHSDPLASPWAHPVQGEDKELTDFTGERPGHSLSQQVPVNSSRCVQQWLLPSHLPPTWVFQGGRSSTISGSRV